jgi:hypothetical protein
MSDDNVGDHTERIEVVPGSVAPLSIDEEATVEAGRRLFLESIEVPRDFAKQMITVSSGAIPIYVALLGIANLKHRSIAALILVSIPALVFLLSALVFVIALLPRGALISVQILDEIREARNRLIVARYFWIKVGFAIFTAGVCLALASVLALMASMR